MEGCLACDLAEGRLPLPGGRIGETEHWLVDHTVGPLGVGTLIVRPKRHVLHVWQLDEAETVELGPFFRRVARALAAVAEPEQLYVTLWSHAGARPGHIHWVFQPVTRAMMDEFGGLYGPHLQVAMFDRNQKPPATEVEAIASRLRGWFEENEES
jgi:diadenosine tetraphosphate (Ap4A) HIT family hydrolase